MNTYFASPERSGGLDLQKEILTISENPVISGLLNTAAGVLAVLNENRQILSVNDDFLTLLGFEDSEKTLGLRPGEVLECKYANLEEGGCGTTRYCSTCGAALAIVAALNKEKPEKRICALQADKGGRILDIALLVRANYIMVEGVRFVLLFLQDITVQQQRAALERTFFHDIRNILSGLQGACEILAITQDRKRQRSLSEMI